ncbi:glucose-1-phosphate adenylyltransferase [Paludisphaera rhizosphaerae]|uniref:glucose-1-phosphate adenylyltransferase n=1 Tax=Paludisphaera rhizosphaerae TaxID=2711216 RepID=UPI0013EDB519|nr:glucose-1-phosphate adenylyltransferase [Paludisphaera rhizosphaerae]
MPRVISLILGGGRGTRLYPLTKSRSKPAVPIAGKYRLIDIPVSNCIHSGLHRIFVVTQFNSVSLHRHIYNTYKFDPFEGGFVEILAAQQTMQSETWYQGTADAVRRNIPYFTEKDYDLVLILSGDQLYRMNFQEMIKTHIENKAVVTIAALPVAESEARSCGIMRIQADGRVIDFEEKPKTQEKLNRVRTDPAWLDKLGLNAHGRPYLASMGIYVFNTKTLVEILNGSTATDFGHELLPQTIAKQRVQAHLFDGYWEDIGTVGAFHQANIDLTLDNPPFDFTHGEQPIYTRPRFLPSSRILGSTIRNSLICDGCIIGRNSVIENSVIGVRSVIGDNVTIRDSYLMGADWYEQPHELRRNQEEGIVNLGVAAGSVVERAIVDKNARIAKGVRVVNETGVVDSEECPTHVIRDGVVVVPKLTVLREGTVI